MEDPSDQEIHEAVIEYGSPIIRAVLLTLASGGTSYALNFDRETYRHSPRLWSLYSALWTRIPTPTLRDLGCPENITAYFTRGLRQGELFLSRERQLRQIVLSLKNG